MTADSTSGTRAQKRKKTSNKSNDDRDLRNDGDAENDAPVEEAQASGAGDEDDGRNGREPQRHPLAYLAKMAQRGTATSGQLAGLNDRFQKGLDQVLQYVGSTNFNNFKLQSAKPSDTVT